MFGRIAPRWQPPGPSRHRDEPGDPPVAWPAWWVMPLADRFMMGPPCRACRADTIRQANAAPTVSILSSSVYGRIFKPTGRESPCPSTAVLPQPWQRLPSTGMLFHTPLTVDIQRAGQQSGEVSGSRFCASPRHARGSNQLGMTPCGRRFQQRGPIRATGRELCSCASTAVACHCQGSTFVSSRGRS